MSLNVDHLLSKWSHFTQQRITNFVRIDALNGLSQIKNRSSSHYRREIIAIRLKTQRKKCVSCSICTFFNCLDHIYLINKFDMRHKLEQKFNRTFMHALTNVRKCDLMWSVRIFFLSQSINWCVIYFCIAYSFWAIHALGQHIIKRI